MRMRIDAQVEPLVRETLAAVVERDPVRSTGAIQTLVDQGDEVFVDAQALCFAVDQHVLCDLHGGPPSSESIASLAESATHMEAWAAIDRPTTETFMTALAHSEDPAEVLFPADATTTGFVVGGWLLSAFAPEDQGWEAMLDETLRALAQKPILPGTWT